MSSTLRYACAALVLLLSAFSLPSKAPAEKNSDEIIKSQLVDHLVWDDRIDASNVAVEVQGGHVTLTGTVSSLEARITASEDAKDIFGVISVTNLLQIEAEPDADVPLWQAAKNVLQWSPDIDAETISIHAYAGIVTLEGSVDALWKKHRAEELVKDMGGVLLVRNKLAVVPDSDSVDSVVAAEIIEAMELDPRVDAENVDVKVEEGNVTLQGLVRDWVARDAAFDAALYTFGVRTVENRIQVENVSSIPDAVIKKRVQRRLELDSRLWGADVTVEVSDGKVTFEGEVPSNTAREAAADMALNVQGVNMVVDRLSISPRRLGTLGEELAGRAEELLRSSGVETEDITVTADRWTLTLTGSVDSLWRKQQAEEVVSNIPGIQEVVNRLAVVPSEDIRDEEIAEDIVSALARNAAARAEDIHVEVADGVVTLSGFAPDWSSHKETVETAVFTGGVKDVRDEIIVRQP
jgi:osmotically-inducible protein OsmY